MTKKPKQFYVYILRDPRPGKDMEPFYVGKGHRQRATYHSRKADVHYNPFMRNVLGRIFAADLKPVTEIVRHYDVEAEAFRLEIDLISLYGRRDLGLGTLCNLTDGGEGVAGCLAKVEALRKRWSDPEYRKAHSELWHKQRADPEFAKARVEGLRATMRKLNADPEYRKARSGGLHKQRADPEFAKALYEGLRSHHSNPEWKKVYAERMRLLNTEPDFVAARDESLRKSRAKRIAGLSALNADPEFRKARLDGIRKRHADPEYAKMNSARLSERMRKRMADPEFRAMLATKKAAKRAAKLAAKAAPAGSTPANNNLAKALAA